ncbi:DoxX family protein [Alteromonas sp. ALT199]|uniref:DoxX family protein n=1 Tax=unclassified Alteromonas TaxID=2614992 RepID=UPI00044B469F|nr:DoxX family protein [Alteromonas sp. ALT199]MBT3135275.1 DoxX family protein [Alteromonas sp. ALT199]
MKKYGFNIARGLIALVLVAGGGAKLAGVPELHESFHILGLPGWFGYFIGVCEIAGAIGLFISSLSAISAAGIATIMSGAVYFHFMYTPPAEGIPALVILGLSVFVVIKTKSKIFKFSKT